MHDLALNFLLETSHLYVLSHSSWRFMCLFRYNNAPCMDTYQNVGYNQEYPRHKIGVVVISVVEDGEDTMMTLKKI